MSLKRYYKNGENPYCEILKLIFVCYNNSENNFNYNIRIDIYYNLNGPQKYIPYIKTKIQKYF